MKFTKESRKLEAEVLKKFGLLPEEIEGYFEFFDELRALERFRNKVKNNKPVIN